MRSIRIYVTQIDRKNNSEHVAVHTFTIAGYREVLSYGGWALAYKNRNKTKNYLFYARDEEEYELSLAGKKYHDTLDIKRIEHGSLWEFYKFIGYDYKSKRYISS